MMAVVSQLQHAILTMPWAIRCAAAQATAKVRLLRENSGFSAYAHVASSCAYFVQVAVRSEEPYRIHCYSILRSLAASDLTMGHDFLGVHVSQPVFGVTAMSGCLMSSQAAQGFLCPG